MRSADANAAHPSHRPPLASEMFTGNHKLCPGATEIFEMTISRATLASYTRKGPVSSDAPGFEMETADGDRGPADSNCTAGILPGSFRSVCKVGRMDAQ